MTRMMNLTQPPWLLPEIPENLSQSPWLLPGILGGLLPGLPDDFEKKTMFWSGASLYLTLIPVVLNDCFFSDLGTTTM